MGQHSLSGITYQTQEVHLTMRVSFLRHITTLIAAMLTFGVAQGNEQQQKSQYQRKYDAAHPVVIVGDWDKPPYEFQDEKGEPAGTNVEVMTEVLSRLGIPYKFVLKEWANALKTFERGDADLILANAKRYRKDPFHYTHNIINYNRIVAVTCGTTSSTYSLKELVEAGTVLKPADYTSQYFLEEDSSYLSRLEFQSPKVALIGILAHDFKYYVWGEEPLKWKIRQLNMDKSGFILNDVGIPVSEIHVIGRDAKLIADIDYAYSQLKQSGRVALINDKWLHPERVHKKTIPLWAYLMLGAVMFALLCYMGNLMARKKVRAKSQRNSELDAMMTRALQMGYHYVLQYDLASRMLTNQYGSLLPDEGMSWFDFSQRLHSAERNNWVRRLEQLRDGSMNKHIALSARWNVGTKDKPIWKHLRGHFAVEHDEYGQPSTIYAIIVDVTHNVGLIHEANKMEQKFLQFFQLSKVAMAVYNQNGWIENSNEEMKRICKADAKNARLLQNTSLFDMPMFADAFNKSRHDPIYLCHLAPADSYQGCEACVEYNVIPLFDYFGRVSNYLLMAYDIKVQRDTYHHLIMCQRECDTLQRYIDYNEKRLKFMLNHSDWTMWDLDLRNKMIYYSHTLKHADYVIEFENYLKQLPASLYDEYKISDESIGLFQGPFHVKRQYSSSILSKGPCTHDIYGRLRKSEDGVTLGYSGVLHDITRLENLKKEVVEISEKTKNSAQQKSVFLAQMTHELRTPLNSIVGFSDMLKYAESAGERERFIHIIRTHCDILVRLINGILEASTINDNPMDVQPAEVDFAEEFEYLCQAFEIRVQRHNLRFVTSKPLKKLSVLIDIGRVRQVLNNFVSNALKYTKKGSIWVGYRLEKRNGQMGIYAFCEDTGTGIPHDKQSVVFDRFVKLNEFVQGTGLGLSICKSIVTACHGDIGVESEVDKGSKFWFWIPVEIIEKNQEE